MQLCAATGRAEGLQFDINRAYARSIGHREDILIFRDKEFVLDAVCGRENVEMTANHKFRSGVYHIHLQLSKYEITTRGSS